MKNSAQQFYFKTKKGHYLLAGYPWFGVRARDQFIALPGCTLAVGDDKIFEDVMHLSEKELRHFMSSGELDENIGEIDLPDIPLWALWTVYHYAKEKGM